MQVCMIFTRSAICNLLYRHAAAWSSRRISYMTVDNAARAATMSAEACWSKITMLLLLLLRRLLLLLPPLLLLLLLLPLLLGILVCARIWLASI